MLNFYGQSFNSRLLIGTARYPSPDVLQKTIHSSSTEIVTVSLRRESQGQDAGKRFWQLLKDSGVSILPNTAGCMSVKEAVTTAHMARDLFETPWIKLEVIGDDQTQQPDPFGLVEAARILINDGFKVFPYTTEDAMVAQKLVTAGCEVIMPWGSMIGSGQGILYPHAIKLLRKRFPQVTLVLDAGIGKPSHAAIAMELGCDAVLVNTALALAHDPVSMGRAFKMAVDAGRAGYESGMMSVRDMAQASTPVVGKPFWQQDQPLETTHL